MKTKVILIVEDDKDIRESLKEALEFEGYSTLAAENGQDALDVLDAIDAPSLILLDLMMPIMNAWQFRDRQKMIPKLAQIPIVVISADGNLGKKATDLEPTSYLKKPVDLDALLRVVQKILLDPFACRNNQSIKAT